MFTSFCLLCCQAVSPIRMLQSPLQCWWYQEDLHYHLIVVDMKPPESYLSEQESIHFFILNQKMYHKLYQQFKKKTFSNGHIILCWSPSYIISVLQIIDITSFLHMLYIKELD